MKIRLRKKIISSLIIEGVFLCASLFAISLTASITDIEQSDDLGDDIFPVGAYLNYGIYDFKTLPDMPLRFSVALAGGYTTNTISQNPSDGLADWCDGYEEELDYDTYGAIFSYYEFKLAQKYPLPFDIPGTFDTWTSLYCRYERPVSLIGDSSETSAFYDSDGNFNSDVWDIDSGDYVGTPDLNGNMYLRSFAWKTGTSYKHELLDLPYTWSQTFTFAPEYLLFNSGTDSYGGFTDYIKLKETFYIYKELKSENYISPLTNQDFRLYNLVASDYIYYRYLNGDGVPNYDQDYDNLTHAIVNTLKLTIKGPQMFTSDTYPSAYLAYIASYEWGKLNNCSTDNYYSSDDSFSHYYRFSVDMRIIGIIHLGAYYDWDLDQDSLISGSGDWTVNCYISY